MDILQRTTGPTRAFRTAAAATIAAGALLLAACGDPQPPTQPTPAPSTAAPSTAAPSTADPSATDPAGTATPAPPVVYGELSVMFALTTPDSVLPNPPISYAVVLTAPGANRGTLHPVTPEGGFALELPAGTYDLAYVQIDADDLAPDPFPIAIATSRRFRVEVPAQGCVYGGQLNVVYGRLPALDEQRQTELVQRAADNNQTNYSFHYLPSGGLVVAGASVAMPDPVERPAWARDCVAEKFAPVAA